MQLREHLDYRNFHIGIRSHIQIGHFSQMYMTEYTHIQMQEIYN